MKQRIIMFAVATVFLGIFAVQATAETPEEMIKKAIEAHGGLDAVKKFPGSESTMKGTMVIGGASIPIEGEHIYFLPDLAKNVIRTTFGGQKIAIEQIWNGKKFKMTANGVQVPASAAVKDQLNDTIFTQKALYLYPLLEEKGFELSVIDNPGKFADKDVVGVLIKAKGHKDIKLYLDAKTFVMVGIERQGLDAMEKEVAQKTVIDDLKKIEGILTPVKMTILNNGEKYMSIDITDVKYLTKVDKKQFDIAD